MTFTEELRGLLPLRPAGVLTRPADVLAARRLTASLGADGDSHGGPRGAQRTFSDLLVFRLGIGGAQPVVVKHPRSPRATASLAHECEVVGRLARDDRLGLWRRLLPTVQERRLEGPLPLVVESCLPGIGADALLRRSPQLTRQVTVSALRAIRELHRVTGRTEDVTAFVADWVAPRLAALAEEVRWCRRGRGAEALTLLGEHLGRELTGRRLLVAWTHGDFHPGNLLVEEEWGAVCGVIDWAGAVPEGPSLLDCHTFVLTMRHQRGGRQFGRVVADVVRRGSLPPEDRRLLADAGVPAQDDREEVALALLAWLWHAAGNVTKSARYGRSRRWVDDNVVTVLGEVVTHETR